jgi:polyhydroxyalkanoate synthesis repressor PhaR
METERIVKKYPNRRLYDTTSSRYVTLEDIRTLVRESVRFRIVDAKTDEDITRSILLQIILEQEDKGQPIFSTEVLEQIIRSYGDTMQGFLSSYLKQSIEVFLQQQKLVQEQMAGLMQSGPLSVFTELTQKNLRLWQSMQETALKTYGLDAGGPGNGPPQDES